MRLQDQGPGFPPDVLRALATGGETGGGFGLALVQNYARELGGRLLLGNAPDGGALAGLWLPD